MNDRVRALMATHLTALCNAQAGIKDAKRERDEADRRLAESADGTDWVDRSFFAVFRNDDDGRAHRYREASRARRRAMAEVRKREQLARRADQSFGKELEKALARHDEHYRALKGAIRECDGALRQCRAMTKHLEAALQRPKPATKQDPMRERRFHEAITRARREAPKLQRAIHTAIRTVDLAIDQRLSDPVRLDVALLKDLAQPDEAERPLRTLKGQVTAAITTVTRHRGRAEHARQVALTRARNALIEREPRSEPPPPREPRSEPPPPREPRSEPPPAA
ncbi:hypothetical protein ACQP2F_06200 [Actinoplanes sp. CA-030573]|uniref:hypothetical protein n=1 Tax=Actinoplanes sp. CA-030573 TaxID=3239898 RepID=UPI003D8EE0C5